MLKVKTKKGVAIWSAFILVMVAGTLAVTVCRALAHKVNVFAYLDGRQIKGEAYFPSGDKAQTALVEVVDGQGRVLGSTQTDGQGLFSLAVPAEAGAPLRVVLKAGQGHQGEYTLGARELGGAAAFAAASQAASKPAPATARSAAPLPEEMEERLARLLDQRLQPLTAQVAKLGAERSVSLADVMGGLGYIMGLMGLAAYLKARKQE